MSFVYNDVLPIEFAKSGFVVEDVLVSGQNDVELLIFEELSQSRTLILFSFVGDHSDRGRPFLELVYPVLNGHKRYDHKVGSLVPFVSD